MTDELVTFVLADGREIRPRPVDGEPVCSGENCPTWRVRDDIGVCDGYSIVESMPCTPALRAQRDAAIRERDAARRELCEELADWSQEFNAVSPDPSVHADERGWAYLYDKDGGR